MLEGECIWHHRDRRCGTRGSLLAEGSHRWLERIPATDIRVDLSDIPNLTSPHRCLAGHADRVRAAGDGVGSSRRVEVQLQAARPREDLPPSNDV
jgi:hypothetical protein